jgi:hypothetical protein
MMISLTRPVSIARHAPRFRGESGEAQDGQPFEVKEGYMVLKPGLKGIKIQGADGTDRVTLEEGRGGGVVSCSNHDGNPVSVMGIAPTGAGMMGTKNPAGDRMETLMSERNNTGLVTALNASGNPVASLRVAPGGRGSVELLDSLGERGKGITYNKSYNIYT